MYFSIPVIVNYMRYLGPQTEEGRGQAADGHLLCFSILLLILINSLRSLIFENIGLASLIDFGTNTLASLVYFSIPVVANNMRSLGPYLADSNRRGNY